MINKYLNIFLGGGKRFFAMIIVTILFWGFVPKDSVTFACYVGFVGAWAKFDTDRRGE